MLPVHMPTPEPPLKRHRSLPADSCTGSSQGAACGTGGGATGGSNISQLAATPAPTQAPPQQPSGQQRQQAANQSSQLSLSQPQPQQRPSPYGGGGGGAAAAVTAVLPTLLPGWAEAALRGVDPFWEPQEVLAVITTQLTGPAPGTHGQLQSSSALFTVSPAVLAAINEGRAQARFVCVQPNDGPPNRCHWYGGSYALLNGAPYEVTKEDRTALLLGPNQSDKAADLSAGLRAGSNRLTLMWPVGVAGAVAALRVCARRTPQQLAAALAPPLLLQRAVADVAAHMAGGGSSGGGGFAEGAAAATADGGEELGSGLLSLSLRCPLSGALAAAPAHFGCLAGGAPLAFFDAAPFLELAERSGSWVCPVTGRLGSAEDLRPHAYLRAVLAAIEAGGAAGRVEMIEVAPDGRWRPRGSRVPFLSLLDPDQARFDPNLLDPEDAPGGGADVVDLTED